MALSAPVPSASARFWRSNSTSSFPRTVQRRQRLDGDLRKGRGGIRYDGGHAPNRVTAGKVPAEARTDQQVALLDVGGDRHMLKL